MSIVRPDDLTDTHVDAPGYLIVDQLEELWADGIPADRRSRLLDLLAHRPSAGRATVVILRADFFQSALTEPVLREALDDPVVIGPPGRDQLVEIIVEPARSLGFTVEPSLVTLLLDTVAPAGSGGGDRSLLPLLSYVLLLCWERSRRRRITVADYYASGGVEDAVRASAEAIYQALDPAGRDACRSLFLRLVDVSSERAVRRRAPLAELADELVVVATPFAHAGLLTVDGHAVTPTHEILFSSWPRLVNWIDADREGLRILARLRSDAADWEASGRREAALPTASATVDYLTWRDDDDGGPGSHLAESELQFLIEAESHHASLVRTDRRRIRALTGLVASLAVVTVLALVASGLAFNATSEARQTRDVALSRSGSVSSTSAFTSDPALGRALALAAYRIHPTSEARSALLNTNRADVPLRFQAAAGSGRVEELPGSDWFTSVSSDGQLRMFREGHTDPALLATLETGAGPFHSVAFSPDGDTLASGTGDGRVLRWPLAPRDGLPTVTEQRADVALPDPGADQSKPVEALAWLSDSTTLLVTNRTSHVRLWPLGRLGAASESNSIFQTASSADRTTGVLGVTAAELHYTVVDTTGPAPRETGRVIPDDDTRFSGSLAMAPDGHTVYAGLADGGIQVFTAPFGPATRSVADPSEPVELSSFTAPPGEIYWTAFSADDERLLTTSSTGQVTVIDVGDPAAPEPWAVLGAITDPLLYQGRSASPDGGLLAVGVEGAMWMWQLDPGVVVDEACSGGVQLTDEEWGRHFPDSEPFELCD